MQQRFSRLLLTCTTLLLLLSTSSIVPVQVAADTQTRLATAQLRVCQRRETVITALLTRLADRGRRHLTLFTTIASRTEAFYTKRGKTLSTYDTLVADVTAKQAHAQAAVNATATASSGFSCTGSDPKGFLATFLNSLHTEISALQDYRTAVKNLIVGVKSVQGSTQSSANQNTTGGNQ